MLVIPGVTKVRTLSLEAHESEITVPCVSQQKIRLDLRGVVVYKVGDDYPSIANAARRFLDRPAAELESKVQNVFVGHLRAIAGSMTVEEMISDQDKFAQQVRDRCSQEMESFGLVIDSFQIQAITSPSNYIENLAVPHQAEVEQNARIARANADREAVAAEQDAAAQDRRVDARHGDQEGRLPGRDRQGQPGRRPAGPARPGDGAPGGRRGGDQGRRAPGPAEGAAAPGRRAQARRRRGVQADDAGRGRPRRRASARPRHEAQRVRLAGRGAGRRRPSSRPRRRPTRPRLNGQAEADAIRARGMAEADAVRARMEAEATGIERRAAALSQNQEAVIAQQIAENLPAIVQAAASPFEHVGNFTVLNGAEGVTGALAQIIQQAGSAVGHGSRGADAQAGISPNGHGVERDRAQRHRQRQTCQGRTQ